MTLYQLALGLAPHGAVSWTSQKGFVNAIAAHAVMHLKHNSSKQKLTEMQKSHSYVPKAALHARIVAGTAGAATTVPNCAPAAA